VRLLIASGVNPNTRSSNAYIISLLHLAIEMEYVEVVKLLVKAGADIEEIEMDITPLQRAEKKKNAAIISILIGAGAKKDKEQ
jgi:ankyrin repeat protein